MENNGYGTPLNGVAPNYSYATALPPPPVRTVGAGLSSLADALINGNNAYLANQRQGAPMQLQGAQPSPGLMSAIFGGAAGAQPPIVTNDPTTDSGIY
jgi:hypothetical protein